ncbi:cache domain-containing sensor histidine kinase [Vallitalea maricola]|uniref:Sensor histidine kinase n=1 Tax=Vallitalea maricola TaxID=3074433 RepID=A0ACB5UGZ9_9FIRM|nr:sensor histidine kinase [Vallitalea sp. AN17-2]
MNPFKRSISLQKKLMLTIFLVAFIPMVILPLIGYFYTSNLLKDKLEVLTNQNVEEIENGINHVIDDIIIASNVIVLDKEIQKNLHNKMDSITKEIQQKKVIESKLENMEASNLFPYNVESILLDFNGNYYHTGIERYYDYNQIVKEDWFIDTVNKNGFFLWDAPTTKILQFQGGITLVRLLKEDYYEATGVLAIHLYPEKKVKKLLVREEDYGGTERYLLNSSGEIILDSINHMKEPKYINQLAHIISEEGVVHIGGESVFVSIREIEKTNWTLVQIIPYNSVMQEVKHYRNFTIFLNCVFIGLMLFSAYVASRQVTKAIKKLNQTVNQVTKGDLTVKSNITGSIEVNQLSESFNYMVDEINGLIENVKLEIEQKQKFKLEALQAQINPHFLLNTLNGIKWLCVIENAKTAEKMLVSLGYLLENTLEKYDDFISLEDEIKCLESYVKLQKMRYGKRFRIEYNIHEQVRTIKIPVLLLQPILENSILHAFDKPFEGEGLITVQASPKAGFVEIIILDNGVGMNQEKVQKLMEGIRKNEKYSGMGVKNVKERVKLYYESPCGLWIESEEGVGTKTTIIIKDLLDGDEDDESINS